METHGSTPMDFLQEETQSKRLLEEYFHTGRYTGRHFEALIAGSDADRFTPADILAVRMLSVSIPPDAAMVLLQDEAEKYASKLKRILLEGTIWNPGAALDRNSDAWSLYDMLCKLPGISHTTASKLLAAKRPELVPIYDKVVGAALGFSTPLQRYWESWLEWARDEELKDAAIRARDAAGLDPARVSLLRVIDVVIWMSARR